MFTVLMVLEIIVSVLLMLVVLMQASKGGGLAGTFGGANVGMMFGVRRTADFLTKGTQILGITFGVLALIINLFFLPRAEQTTRSILEGGTTQRPATTELPAPAPIVPGEQGGTTNQ